MKGNTWLILGGVGAAIVVLILATRQSNNQQVNADPASQFVPASNVGTPTGNNDSLVGFTDPTSGIQWILHSGSMQLSNGQIVTSGTQWQATLPTGMLPPNYQPGEAFIIPTLFPSPTNVSGSIFA